MTQVTAKENISTFALSKELRSKTRFSKIGVVGCGLMGRDIVRILSKHGLNVIFLEVSDEMVEQAMTAIKKDLDRMIGRWGMTVSEKRAILSRIKGSTSYKELKGCDLVIETIKTKRRSRVFDYRKEVLKNIEDNVSRDTIISTNSISVIITELTSELAHPERCISLHFMAPEPEVNIIEIAKGLYTSDEVYGDVLKFAKLLKKRVIEVDESPGLISVRLFVPFLNEACEILMEDVGKMNDIDATMRIGFGLTQGPFEMADKIGLDKVLSWMNVLYEEYGDLKYKPSPLIKKLVRTNKLGRKNRIGFYEYGDDEMKIRK